jgi:GTP pyrophosphokinase
MKSLVDIWPYIELAKHLIKKQRRGAGNMFRHQIETFAILLEFGYDNPVLLKAALIHDLFEDGEKVGFTHFEDILTTDHDGRAVYDLVNELTIRVENGIEEPKTIFLHRIMTSGSQLAKLLKIADRLSNINTLFATNDKKFIIRYLDETWKCIMPFAKNIDISIAEELESNLKKLESIT